MGEFFEEGGPHGPAIAYDGIAADFFTSPADRTQKMVPFLGAGASLGPRPEWKEPPAHYPDAAITQSVIDTLGLSGTSRRFMELAVRLASKIQDSEQSALNGQVRPDPVLVAQKAKYPPSASELSAALAFRSKFDGFERPRQRVASVLTANDRELVELLRWIAELTEIGPAVPPLLSVASYYEYTLQRSRLWRDLRSIFENKTTPTRTHWLTARAAEHHLSLRPRKDYLIITTNYDRLMEIALEKTGVPFCVMTVGSIDQYVDVVFSANMRDFLELTPNEFASLKQEHSRKYARNFSLDVPKPIVIVYKLHGCLFPEEPERDSVVLSDEDYIRYLMQMYDAAGVIPSEITRQMASAAFLFLGYSFSDWNVRGMYKAIVKQRSAAQAKGVSDFAVVRDFSAYESAFSREGNGRIHLLVTDLARFARGMMHYAPARPRTKKQKARA
jgi:SIR2-like domain